eukprot:SAG25_NODE_3749_length_980_cov_2.627696_1_plen_45_part_01
MRYCTLLLPSAAVALSVSSWVREALPSQAAHPVRMKGYHEAQLVP